MDPLTIPEEQILPIESVAAGIQGLRIAFVNVFSVAHADGTWTLVDAALPFTAPVIRRWVEKHRNGQPPRAIVLTHGHFDHVSAAGALADEWNLPIYAHPLEFPYLTGKQEYPAPNVGAGGGMMSLLSPLYPRGPIDLSHRLQPLPSGDAAAEDAMPGWTILETPGHTPGHISLYRERDRILLAGDAFCTTKPESFFDATVSVKPELHGPPSYFTSDWEAARDSVAKLARLNPTVVAPGHGRPLTGDQLPQELQALAANFTDLAVPSNRRSA